MLRFAPRTNEIQRRTRMVKGRTRKAFFEPLEERSLLAILTWVGDVDANWNTNSGGNTNWNTNTLPADGDTLIFDGTGANFTQNNDTPALNSYTLQFTAGGYTIGGNAITLDNALTDISSTTGTNNINTPFTMVVDTTLDVGGTAVVVTGGIMSGGGGLTKLGTGTLNLNALNTYTGNNLISAGIAISSITTSGAGAFGAFNSAPTKIVVQSGATVDINGSARGSAPGIDFFYGLTIAGTGSAGQGALVNNGPNGGTGNRSSPFITLSADATIGGSGNILMVNGGHAANTLNLNGFTLTKSGTNTFFLDNTTVTAGTINVQSGGLSQINGPSNASAAGIVLANAAGANLTLNSNSLTIGSLSGGGTTGGNIILGAHTLTVNQAVDNVYGGVISGTGALVKSGLATLSLTAANTYTGATTVSQGTLQLGNGGTTGSLAAASTVTLGNAATLANPVAFVVNRSDNNTHANPIIVSALGTGTATIGSAGTSAGSLPTIFSGTINLNRPTTMQGTDPDRTTYTNVISGTVGTLTVTGGARSTWEANNTFVGNVNLTTAGTILQVGGAGNQIPDASNVDLAAGTFLRLNNDGEAINSLTGSGTVENIVGGNTLTVGANNGSGSFGGVLQNGSGALSLIKAGTGTQTLTGTVGAFTGAVTVNGGSLVLNRAGAAFDAGYFPTTTTLTVNTGAILNAANLWNIGSANNVQVNGGTVTFSAGAANDGVNYMNNLTLNGGTVSGNPFRVGNTTNGIFNVVGSAASTISAEILLVNDVDVTGVRTLTLNVADAVAGAATDLTISSVVRDLGQNGTSPLRRGTQLIKTGAGTLALTNANTYTGVTNVNVGVVDISNGSALGTGPVVIIGGGTLDLRNNITVPNALTLNQSGSLGTLRNAAGDNTWSGSIVIPTNLQSVINVAAGTLTVSGNLTSNGYGNKTGPGTLILTGVNGGSGWMDVSQGLVSLRSNTAAVGTYFHVDNPAAAVELNGGVSIPAGEIIYLSGVPAGSFAPLNGVNGANTFGGTVVLHNTVGNRNIGADAGSSLTITGNVTGPGRSLTKVGGGTVTLAGTNNYDGTTTVSTGTLVLQNGNAILNTGGAVSVALGATLQLLNNETVSSFSGAGDLVGTNDSLLALGGNTLTTTGSAAIANVTTTTGGGIIAGGAITDADDDLNITGTNLFLQAAAGIGTSVDPLETAVSGLQVRNTASGVINIANTGSLTISDLRTLGYGARNDAGATTIANTGAMTVSAASISSGSVVLTATDNLLTSAGITVQSTGGSVTLSAGDDLSVAGNVTSAGTATFNVDAGDTDVGVGGSLTITSVVTTPTVGSGGGAYLNGSTDNDTFTFNPQTTTEFRVAGNLPTAVTPGDLLVMNVSGTTNPNLTVPGTTAPYTGAGSGSWSFTSAHQPVLFSSIEQSTVTGSHHLTYDNSVTPVANLIVMRDSALPTASLQLRDGSTAGPLVYQGSLSAILSLRILGSTGNDTVTVDDINTLPDFAGTVPGVADNANLVGTAELLFDGLGGSDSLVFNLTGATASQTYAIGNGTGAAGLEGEIQSIAAGLTLQTYFQNVDLARRTGAGATPGGLTITGDSGANAFSIAANGALSNAAIAGYTPFEFSGNNYSAVDVNMLGGIDSLDLISLGTGQTNNPAITLSGGTEADTLRVRSTSGNAGTVTLLGGAGSDLFQLFDAGNTVDNIAGSVVIDGTDGNIGGNTDTLTIVDSGDLTGDSVVVAAVDPLTSGDYYVEGMNSAPGSDVIFRNLDVLNYTGTSGNDTIDGRFVDTVPTHDLNSVALAGWLGGDQFLLFTSDQLGGTGAFTPTGVPSGLATITLYGDAPGNPNPGDGLDTFGATPAGVTGTGAGNVGLVVPSTTRMIRPSVSTGITINGGTPTGLTAPLGDASGDVLNVDMSALPNASPVILATFSPGALVNAGIEPVNWAEIEDINLVDQGRLTNVQMGDLFARGTPSPDLIQYTRNPTQTNPNGVRLRINSLVGDYSISNKSISYAGGGNDTLTQANLTVPAEFYGEAGNDNLFGAMNNDMLVGGEGHDKINASGGNNVVWGDNSPTLPGDPTPQDSAVGGDDILSGLGGNDVFYGGAGNDSISAGGGNDYASGGQGDDTIGGSDGDDRLYGGPGNDVIGGGSGHDLLSGGDGDDKLYGNDGNDVLYGGSGGDLIDGGNGSDLLVTGSVANESSTRTSVPSTSTFSPVTYSNPADNDAALLTLLIQWSTTGNRGTLGTSPAITHDGVADDVYGGTGDDDFCWETADVLKYFPSTTPPDYNAPLMGTDERFGPT